MKTSISKSVAGGIIGTAAMSIEMYLASMMGMPKMSPPDKLVGMLSIPLIAAWLMHFTIGITYAMAYTHLFAPKVKISNIYLKGAVFGFAAFVFAQIAIATMEALFQPAQMEGTIIQLMIGSIIGHIVFGIGVSKTIGHALCTDKAIEKT